MKDDERALWEWLWDKRVVNKSHDPATDFAEAHGMSEKRLYRILFKWSDRNLWDYGVNARWGWFTSKGLAAGREAKGGNEEGA